MQSRRHEDFDPPFTFDRRRRNNELNPDGHLMLSPRSKRGWSPRKMDGSTYSDRPVAGRRSVSLERRRTDYGSRSIRSRSPVYMEPKKGRLFYRDDWVTDKDFLSPERSSRREFFDHMDRKHDDADFDYGNGSFRTSLRDDKFEVRRFNSGIHDLSSQKSAVTGLYKSTGDVGPYFKPETSGDLTSASLNIGLGQVGKERVRYPDVHDSYTLDKLISVKHYGEEDKNMAHSRDNSYSNLDAVKTNESSMGASHFKDYARTSPRKSRTDHLDYRGGIPYPRDSPPLNTRHMPKPLSHSRYEQRQHLELCRDTDLDINDGMDPYREGRFSPPITGRLDSFRLQPRTREKNDYLYPSGEIYEKMDVNERVGYNGREMIKPSLLDCVTQRAETSDIAHRNMRSRGSLDRIPVTATNNIGLNRSPAEKRKSVQYLDTVPVHSRLGMRVLREEEMRYMGMAQDHEVERARVDYDYKRDLTSGSHKEKMVSFQGFSYEREHGMESRDLSPYDSSNRYLKRKYPVEYEDDRIPSRSTMSRCDTVNRRHDQDFIDEEWIDQDARRSSLSKRKQHDYVDDEFINDLDEFIHDYDHHTRSPIYDDKYAKGYSRSSVSIRSENYHPRRRNFLPSWKNGPIRSENYKDADMYSSEVEQYEPRHDTKEFKQLVNDYFLSFTKKLNENPVTRRRYMEKGRAGSLLCIVCGRSVSKEFLDTQRLAMHAFMSHKSGLRAQHLGLLKAICVMLGWNGVIPADTPRWFPEILSTTETLAQKQDLIIWPPVVIVHNISILDSNTNGQGPTTEEALGQYLRGKGLSGGKVKLGKPANCSIMLVKFLGTFSGLQDAEKIHEHFSKNRHGRKHLEQITSGKGKSHREESEKNADKEAEQVLFGYMGIAEDLDKVDIDTKRKCSIKSKKEIQDIADAPVKPDE
ncbi:hypothetical protein QVD17_32371 [Tagetes erecta]|uniref:XS domain-containing protein n=1 Tax=Tagetes erecta TaxID=13708 RepID=A0AAD8NHX3_TARER|nr:hypothetical protein QVD17_32371 [Tagetes erecta]